MYFSVADRADYNYVTEFHIDDKTLGQDIANPDSSEHQQLLVKLIEEVKVVVKLYRDNMLTFSKIYGIFEII